MFTTIRGFFGGERNINKSANNMQKGAPMSSCPNVVETHLVAKGTVHIVFSAENGKTAVLKWQEEKGRNIVPSRSLPNMINNELRKFTGCKEVHMHIITCPNSDPKATAALNNHVKRAFKSSMGTFKLCDFSTDYFLDDTFDPTKIPHDYFDSYILENNQPIPATNQANQHNNGLLDSKLQTPAHSFIK